MKKFLIVSIFLLSATAVYAELRMLDNNTVVNVERVEKNTEVYSFDRMTSTQRELLNEIASDDIIHAQELRGKQDALTHINTVIDFYNQNHVPDQPANEEVVRP